MLPQAAGPCAILPPMARLDQTEADDAKDNTLVRHEGATDSVVTTTRPIPRYSQETQDRFCAMLRHGVPITRICRSLHVSRPNIYLFKGESPLFATAWDTAKSLAEQSKTDELEESAVTRATVGSRRRVYYKGAEVSVKEDRQHHDNLAQFLLTGRKPERYGREREGDVQINVNIVQFQLPGSVPAVPSMPLDDEVVVEVEPLEE